MTPRLEDCSTAPGDFSHLREAIAGTGRKLVVLDDDPTGTQTVHGLEVLTEWSAATLAAALRDPRPAFFVLTNSRGQPEAAAREMNQQIARNLEEAAAATGCGFTLASRSDSTLRGHFPAELDALRSALAQPVDGVVVVPAFFEGRRFTIGDVHYLGDGGQLVPVADTEFARDAAFGYRHSNLREWIEEKTDGRIRADEVTSLSLELLRHGGADAVRASLCGLEHGRYAIVNAAGYADLEIFVRGLLDAERAGKRLLLRTAASFVGVRAGTARRTLLRADEIAAGSTPGLIVVGSYVNRTTVQLQEALGLAEVRAIEVGVGTLREASHRAAEIQRVAAATNEALGAGQHALVYTSRNQSSALGQAGDLEVAAVVSEVLVAIVRRVQQRPRFVIAKGGITSSDLAVRGFGVRRATILGQVFPGIPVWRLGPESSHPGLPYIVFPGNVGTPSTLRDLIVALRGSGARLSAAAATRIT